MHLAPGTVIMTLDSPHANPGLLGVIYETVVFPSLTKPSGKDYYYQCFCHELGQTYLAEEELQVISGPEVVEVGKKVRIISVTRIEEGIITNVSDNKKWVHVIIDGECEQVYLHNIIPKFISNKSSKNLLDKEF